MEKETCPFVPNTLLGLAGGIQYRKLKKASQDPKKSSAETLRSILRYAEHSEYGKEHHFSDILQAKTDDELFALYQKNVPLNDYEDLKPYIDKHRNGGENILFPGKPTIYATTSGTTNEPKWIPITPKYMEDVYGKMTKVWLYNFIMNRPKVFTGKILSIVGKTKEGEAPDGTFFGSVSGVTQQNCPGFVKKLYTCPFSVYSIEDYTARYYVLMRTAIEHNVTLIVTANPSTVVELRNNVNVFFDDYCNDIAKGTIKADLNIPDWIREDIQQTLKPNPERAKELRELKAKYGTVLPKHYWPNIQILNTWKCGNTKVYLDKFKGAFPDTMLHQEFGYFSSECRFGLVLDDTNNTVLFPHLHYYEFVAEEELESENKHFLQLHELQKGKRYCPYVTTFAGLYRYNMNDLLEASDKFENTPTVFMIQKVNGIVTMTGEKLHERQFIEAVRRVEKSMQTPLAFFIGFAVLEESTYHFYLEFADQSTSQEVADEFVKNVDKELMTINVEYKAKRESFRVKDPVAHRLVKQSFEQFKEECIKEGKRDGQFKILLLMQDEARHEKFKKLILK